MKNKSQKEEEEEGGGKMSQPGWCEGTAMHSGQKKENKEKNRNFKKEVF